MFKTLTSGLALAAGLIAAGPIFAHDGGQTVHRTDPAPFGPATAESWVTLDDHGRPLEIGVAFSGEGFAAIAEHKDAALSLPMPPEAAATGIDHLYLTWNRFGHPPAGMFDVPHFDVHFYMVDEAERLAIDTSDPDFWRKAMNEPDRSFMPADYMPPPEPEPVPGMGVHWVDVTDPVFRGEPFDEVFIYGAWDGAVTFLEPMITLDVFTSKQTIVSEVKQPVKVSKPGFYPQRYRIGFDEGRGAHVVVLEDLVLRTPDDGGPATDHQAALTR